jgi:hypothetical protein
MPLPRHSTKRLGTRSKKTISKDRRSRSNASRRSLQSKDSNIKKTIPLQVNFGNRGAPSHVACFKLFLAKLALLTVKLELGPLHASANNTLEVQRPLATPHH